MYFCRFQLKTDIMKQNRRKCVPQDLLRLAKEKKKHSIYSFYAPCVNIISTPATTYHIFE